MLGPFARPSGAAPVITPDRESVFQTPGGPLVHWEVLHTFNPAAIVSNGKIYVLYRAEDDSGEMKIGGHASRIGLAESDDGIHFKRDPDPFSTPPTTARSPGSGKGVAKILDRQAEDGTYVMTYTNGNPHLGRCGDCHLKRSAHLDQARPAAGQGFWRSLSEPAIQVGRDRHQADRRPPDRGQD